MSLEGFFCLLTSIHNLKSTILNSIEFNRIAAQITKSNQKFESFNFNIHPFHLANQFKHTHPHPHPHKHPHTYPHLYLANVTLDESEVLVPRWPLPLLARDLGYPIGGQRVQKTTGIIAHQRHTVSTSENNPTFHSEAHVVETIHLTSTMESIFFRDSTAFCLASGSCGSCCVCSSGER